MPKTKVQLNSSKSITKIESLFASKKIKPTELRLKIAQTVFTSKNPIKAYDIIEILSSKENQIKPPTVYRVLDLLIEKNLIHKLEKLNTYIACEHPNHNHHCMQAICNTCGKIEEICDKQIENKIASISKEINFKQINEVIEIYGICQHCQ